MKRALILWLVIFFLSTSSYAAIEKVFPYLGVSLVTPGIEDPLPGFGTYYSSFGLGLDSILWNPASLGYIRSSEGSLGFTTVTDSPKYSRLYTVEDKTFDVGSGGQSQLGFVNAILFTADQNTNAITKRDFEGQLNYNTQSSGVNYKQAVKISDWFAFGITSRGDMGGAVNLVGDFPVTYLMDMNLANTSNFLGTGISIDPAGKLTFSYDQGGVNYVHTSEASVWNGFLRQTQRIPFNVLTDSRNDINIENPLTFTGSTQWQGLSCGFNMTPINASANVDNNIRVIVKDGATDPVFYVPDFDPQNEADAINWLSDPDKFGSEYGYKKRYIEIPEGESIGEARYRGFFKASATKLDLGLMYQPNDYFSFGVALENLGGANLDFSGTGLVSYVNQRISTAEPGSIIDPAAETVWRPFTDYYTPMEGTEGIGMLPTFTVRIPQRTRFGLTLKKPLLISVDYEMQSTPIDYRYQDQTTKNWVSGSITDIRLLRVGSETGVLMLPWQIRGGIGLIFKPTITGLDAKTRESIDNAFKFGMLPVKLDMGTDINFWGNIVGGSFGFNLLPLFSLYQLDTVNTDLNKMLFYGLYAKKDNWKVTYSALLDPGSTGAAYGNRTKDIENVNDAMGIIRTVQTLDIGFKF
jgi:hypothetical protein